jgi:hypothetical protein
VIFASVNRVAGLDAPIRQRFLTMLFASPPDELGRGQLIRMYLRRNLNGLKPPCDAVIDQDTVTEREIVARTNLMTGRQIMGAIRSAVKRSHDRGGDGDMVTVTGNDIDSGFKGISPLSASEIKGYIDDAKEFFPEVEKHFKAAKKVASATHRKRANERAKRTTSGTSTRSPDDGDDGDVSDSSEEFVKAFARFMGSLPSMSSLADSMDDTMLVETMEAMMQANETAMESPENGDLDEWVVMVVFLFGERKVVPARVSPDVTIGDLLDIVMLSPLLPTALRDEAQQRRAAGELLVIDAAKGAQVHSGQIVREAIRHRTALQLLPLESVKEDGAAPAPP